MRTTNKCYMCLVDLEATGKTGWFQCPECDAEYSKLIAHTGANKKLSLRDKIAIMTSADLITQKSIFVGLIKEIEALQERVRLLEKDVAILSPLRGEGPKGF